MMVKQLRGGSRTAATSKVELFVITKSSTLDVAAVLDPPLSCFTIILSYESLELVKHIQDLKESLVRKSSKLKENLSLVTVFCCYNLVVRHSFQCLLLITVQYNISYPIPYQLYTKFNFILPQSFKPCAVMVLYHTNKRKNKQL